MILKDYLDVALKIESKGFEVYSKLSEEFDGEISDLFKDLAEQERQHGVLFKKMFEKYQNMEITPDRDDDERMGYLTSFAELSIFPKLSGEQKPKNLREALDMAVAVEKDSILFYSDLLKFFPEDNQALDKIIDEEKRHMMELIKSYK